MTMIMIMIKKNIMIMIMIKMVIIKIKTIIIKIVMNYISNSTYFPFFALRSKIQFDIKNCFRTYTLVFLFVILETI